MFYERSGYHVYDLCHFGRAVQLGLRRKKLFGALLPAILIAVFTALSLAVRTLALLPIGLACIAAVVAIWCIGYANAGSYEKKNLNKMKSKDL